MKTSPRLGLQSMPFQLFSLLIFLTAANPSWAQAPQAQNQCRIWVQDRILDSNSGLQKQLESKSYKVTRLTGSPRIEEMNQLYDLALYPGQDRKLHSYMTLNSQVLADLGAVSFRPDQLPHCQSIPAYGDSAYFRGYIGRLARQRLDAFYTSGKLLPGIGEIFLQAETLRFFGYKKFSARFKTIQKDYRALVQEVRQTWEASASASTNILERTEHIRELLHPFYEKYLEQQPSLTFTLQWPMAGNCQSSTQLFLFTMIDAGVDLGPDWQLGAQLFIDHVQPVIYNQKNDQIQELVGGKRVEGIAPVYSPELLTYALGRATGRSIPSERESQLLIRKADFKHTEKLLWLNYWVLDQRTHPPAKWGDPFYLVYDPAFSSAAQGRPNPSSGTIPFSGMSDMAFESPSDIISPDRPDLSKLGDFAAIQNMTEMRDAFGNAKAAGDTSPFGSVDPSGIGNSRAGLHANLDEKYWPKVTELYWQAYPVSERPPVNEAQREALASLAVEGTFNRLHLTPKIYLASAKLQEFSTFQEGLTVRVTPREVREMDELQLGDTHLKVWNRPFKILVKNARFLKELKDRNSKLSIADNVTKYFSRESQARFHKLHHESYAKLYSYLWGEAELPTLKELRELDAELKHFLAPLIEVQNLNNYSALWSKEDRSFCNFRETLKREVPIRPDQIENALGRLQKLDPETHRAYFGVLARLEQNEETLDRLDTCMRSNRETIFQQILNQLIMDRLYKNEIQVLEPISIVYPKLVFGETKQKIDIPKNALQAKHQQLQGQVTKKINLTKPQKSKTTTIQTETLMGLIFSVEKNFLQNPLVQIVILDWLNEKTLAYIQSQWANDNLAISSLRSVLDASIFHQETSWMPEPLLAIHRSQQANATAWATFSKPESASVPLSAAFKAYVTNAEFPTMNFTITDVANIKRLNILSSSASSSDQTCNWKSSSFGFTLPEDAVVDDVLNKDLLTVYESSASPCGKLGTYKYAPYEFWELTIHDYKRDRRTLISKSYKVRLENSKLNIYVDSKTMDEAQLRQAFESSRKKEDAVAEKINETEAEAN